MNTGNAAVFINRWQLHRMDSCKILILWVLFNKWIDKWRKITSWFRHITSLIESWENINFLVRRKKVLTQWRTELIVQSTALYRETFGLCRKCYVIVLFCIVWINKHCSGFVFSCNINNKAVKLWGTSLVH